MARQTGIAPAKRDAAYRERARYGASQLAAMLQRRALWCALVVALLQGSLYLIIVPPWQHYDEPTHFEYAWLIAHLGRIPQPGDEDPSMRREILNTLFATDFFRTVPAPDLLADDTEVWLGVSELGHQPLYYDVVSLPLRLVAHLDIVSQLYVARAVSVALFLATVLIAYQLANELVTPNHPLRWALPLGVALIPTFSDVMSSVNNDVGAALCVSLFLWGAVCIIRRGICVRRIVWLIVSALAALLTKNTTAIILPLLPLALLFAQHLHHCRLRTRWILPALLAVSLAAAFTLFTHGDAADWYRWSIAGSQTANTQTAFAGAPLGSHVFVLDTTPDAPTRQLISPIMPGDVEHVSGQKVTIGGWIWANRAVEQAAIGLRYKTSHAGVPSDLTEQVALSTTPTFVAWTVAMPEQLTALSYVLFARQSASDPALRIYLDAAVLTQGSYATTSTPQFSDTEAASGTWADQPFTNLIRNGSAEQRWPRLQPWVDALLFHYIHRSPSQIVAAGFDLARVGPILSTRVLPQTFDSFAGWFGWAGVSFQNPFWIIGSRLIGSIAIIGASIGLVQRRAMRDQSLLYALIFLACTFGLAWANTLLRPLPLLGENDAAAIGRYSFPAIFPTVCVLVGGIWALAPCRWRAAAVAAFLGALVLLNAVALQFIWQWFG